MHIRMSTQRRKGKEYRYTQIVESYRREDGLPATRVIAHLGRLPEATNAALHIALKAARTGDALVLASEVAEQCGGTILANLRYLDMAVLLDCWHHWDLSGLLEEIVGESATTVSFSQVMASLVLQRCCAPRSKLHAVRWISKTALPELLGFDLQAFNNTRVHRTLETLHEHSETLQERLAGRYLRSDGGFTTLFMDVTDTFFEGMGCDLAEQTRTKTKMPNKRCLAIALLVNEHGYPLRWRVMGGKTKDWHVMKQLLDDVGKVPWMHDTPLVMDRAMGNRSTVAELKNSGLRFLTAAHVDSIESYTVQVPHQALADVEIEGTDESYQRDIERVADKARDAGFDEIHEHLFAIDLGVQQPPCEESEPGEAMPFKQRPGPSNGLAEQVQRARNIRRQMDGPPELSRAAVASSLGISSSRVSQLLALLRLAPEVQQRILEAGASFPLGEKRMRPLLGFDSDRQLAVLEELLAPHLARPSEDEAPEDQIGPLRLVAYFNPRLFVDIRRRTAGHCDDIQKRVVELNAELTAAKQSRKREPTFRKFSREVERLHYLDAFDIELDPITFISKAGSAIRSFQGRIMLKPDVWKRRRRYDGFVLLLGHPELPQTARELVDFYRLKDMVEKDFQSIKSLIKLRPIWHQTDPKVLAHIDICMLSLLLERTLRIRLRQADLPDSVQTCIDTLAGCHLNLRSGSFGSQVYEITQLNPEQEELLDALNLRNLGRDEYIRSRALPRARIHIAGRV